MANSSETETRSSGFLPFIVGGLVVAVAVIGYLIYTGGDFGNDNPKVEVQLPDVNLEPSKN